MTYRIMTWSQARFRQKILRLHATFAWFAFYLSQSCSYETTPYHELFLTHEDMKPGTQRTLRAFSVGRKWKMSNFQMSELSRKVSIEQRHVIPTALDRSSDICVHEQARLCSVLFWCGLWGYHEEEEQTPSELISVTLHSTDTMSHSSECDCWCGCRGICHHQARAL